MAWVRTLGLKSVFACKFKSLQIPTLLQTSHSTAERQVLVDSGATDNFISERLLKRMKIGELHLQKPRTIWNIDGTHNKAGSIKDFVDLQVQVGPKTEEMKFLITDLGEDEVVLGYPWLVAFQPKINWKEATITEDMQPIVIKTLGLKMDREVACIAKVWTEFAESTAEPGEEIFIARIKGEALKGASTSTQQAAKALPT
jgi:hypothetical protein